jgi:hypothetical protein
MPESICPAQTDRNLQADQEKVGDVLGMGVVSFFET